MWNYIFEPNTGKHVLTNSIEGKKILNSYLDLLGGSKGKSHISCSKRRLNKEPKCLNNERYSPDCEWTAEGTTTGTARCRRVVSPSSSSSGSLSIDTGPQQTGILTDSERPKSHERHKRPDTPRNPKRRRASHNKSKKTTRLRFKPCTDFTNHSDCDISIGERCQPIPGEQEGICNQVREFS